MSDEMLSDSNIIDFAASQMAETIRQDQRRAAFVKGLRDCADFLEAHPSVPAPWSAELNVFANGKDAMAVVAREATWDKAYVGDYFALRQQFGPVRFDVNCNREVVCRKVVRGTHVVPAQPEREVEDVEWECGDSLLEEIR